ncbi:hypothetical protein DRN52_06935, partial [Thermococci archaeon]
KDTYPLGEIVKIILKERYRERGIEINVENSSISESPVDVASLYERFLNIISSKKEEEYDAVFVATTGGTPAMIRALTIASVVKFGGKVREVYKPVGSNVKEFDFPLRIHSKIGEDIVRTLWDLGMYFSALKLLKENTEVKLSRDEVSLLEAEANFYSFNFEKAKEIITKNGLTLSPNKKVRERSLELFEYIEGLEGKKKDNKSIYKVKVLLEVAEKRWRSGMYAEFLGILFRLLESVLETIYICYGINPWSNGDASDEWRNFINRSPRQSEAATSSGIDLSRPNRISLIFMIPALKEIEEDRDKKRALNEIKRIADRLQSLAELRNKSIIAHGFEGVSREKIICKYSKKESRDIGPIGDEIIIKDLRKLLEKLEMIVSKDNSDSL